MNYTTKEVSKHDNENDCWIIIKDKVYDVTKFLEQHPGGKSVILDNAGKDVTEIWESIHDKSILQSIGKEYLIGSLKGSKENLKSYLPFTDPLWYFLGDSPYYKESHKTLRSFLRSIVEKEIIPNVNDWDLNLKMDNIPVDVYRSLAGNGILRAIVQPFYGSVEENKLNYLNNECPPLPAGIGYKEWDEFHKFIVMDEISRCGAGGVVWSIVGGIGIGLNPLIEFGDLSVISLITKDVLYGKKRICLGVTEPTGGSDVASIKSYVKNNLLYGEKMWITNGYYSDYFVVLARDKDGEGEGMSLFLVEKNNNLKVNSVSCMGMRLSGTSFLQFQGSPIISRIGTKGLGFQMIMMNFNSERIGMSVQANRFSRICYEVALKHSFVRKTFGKKLIDHGVIRQKLSDMIIKIESTHFWIENLMLASKILREKKKLPSQVISMKLGGSIALLKVNSSLTFEYCAREAAQILGGRSYTKGYGSGSTVERLYREVRAYAIPGGSEEIMKELGLKQSLKVTEMLMGGKDNFKKHLQEKSKI